MTLVRGASWPLAIVSVVADEADSRVEALVAVAPDAMRTSTLPGFAGRLLARLPGLISHECDNGASLTFAEELRDTELAHALEHVALQLLRAEGFAGARGETRWDFGADGRGRYRVSIAGVGPHVAEDAMRRAADIVAEIAGR